MRAALAAPKASSITSREGALLSSGSCVLHSCPAPDSSVVWLPRPSMCHPASISSRGLRRARPSLNVIHEAATVPGRPIQCILSPEAGLHLSGPTPLPAQPTCSCGTSDPSHAAGASPYHTAHLPPLTLCPGCPSAWNSLPASSWRVWFLCPSRLSLDTTSSGQLSLMPP